MKIFIGLLVASLALGGVLALPARSPQDDAEVINVPRRGGSQRTDDTDPDFKGFRGVIDTGVGYPFLQPNPHPFLGFFDSFEDIFRRFHTRLWPVELPAVGTDDNSSEEGGVGFSLNGKKGNTTSTVKVVDGHKIEVNETVYGDNNNVFKVRIINVRPLESGENVEETVATSNNDATNDAGNPVTSAPTNRNQNDAQDDIEDDSDERREPLAKKETNENEIDREVKF